MVASSPYYASEEDPPIIMFHGTSDQVVNIEQSQELYDSLQKHNVVSEFVKVSGGSHGGNEMYVAANLDKAVEFFNKAIDAKKASAPAVDTTPAKTDSSEAKKDTVPAADTSAVETDTTKTDTSTTYIASAKAKSLEIVVVGNKLHVEGAVAAMKYKVVSVNGTFTETGDVLGTLDLSRLPSGVYCVIVTGARGQHGIVRFVKK